MLMSLNLLGKRLFPFHVAKLDIFLQTGYLVCFASFVICIITHFSRKAKGVRLFAKGLPLSTNGPRL